MKGRIIKGIAGFYYIYTPDKGVYECKAKGIFRKDKIKPLVGDIVEIDVLDEEGKTGNITEIYERTNALIRPAVANVDQALVIFAAAKPTPNLNLLDRFLISMSKQGLKCIVCFNKTDIVSEKELRMLMETYVNCGYKVICTSALKNEGVEAIRKELYGKTTVLAGPSGVGKSSIMNIIDPDANMEVGNISDKIERGKHTTRHSELRMIKENTYIMDTPGFSSLYVEMDKEELKEHFVEFNEYSDGCKFNGCFHLNEPKCAVKDALFEGKISKTRYENYKLLYNEINDKKKY
jgi:ribosome biogenesis GTPase